MLDLTTIIITKDSAKHIGIVLEHYRRLGPLPRIFVDSKSTDATLAICRSAGARAELIENEANRVEAVLEHVSRLCETDWILRFDDDELPSKRMLEVAPTLARSGRHSQYAFRLVHGLLNNHGGIDALRFYEDPPHFQWRLFNQRLTQFTDTIHSPGFLVSDGVEFSRDDIFVHIQWIVKTYEQRLAKIVSYDLHQEGAGTVWRDYYLIEDHSEALATAYPLVGDEFVETSSDLASSFLRFDGKHLKESTFA